MNAVATPTAPSPVTRAMIMTLGGVALLSGFLVAFAYQLSLPYIEANKRRAIEQAVFRLFPQATARVSMALGSEGMRRTETAAPGEIPVYAVYDKGGQLLGIAAEAAARGYQDVIRVLYGYSPQCRCITGIRVLQSTETPGIGDKIVTDPEFLENFRALDARLNPESSALLHPIVTVRHGTKTEAWQIDAISGASISCNAIGRMLNQSAQTTLPKLARHLDTIRRSP
jgi:electron transport complex protein RnfG